MLLLHQIGSVKIGEVVRYNITYTPAHDRILPAPEYLYLRIRNTSNSALRAAFVHGPYNLYVDAYPAAFNPNQKLDRPREYGIPEFEPMLKAGGTWSCRLVVPESIRHDAGSGGSLHYHDAPSGGPPSGPPSASWVINVCSQVIFSTSAAVHYEILLARDPKSLDSTSGGLAASMPAVFGGNGGGGHDQSGSGKGGSNGGGTTGGGIGSNDGGGSSGTGLGMVLQPGKVSDYQRGRDGRHPDQPKGVFSRAIRLQLEDTASLWNKPQLPGWTDAPSLRVKDTATPSQAQPQPIPVLQTRDAQEKLDQQQQEQQQAPLDEPRLPKQKKVHLVVLTHGLHSNLGGDMLYLKESIDAAVQQAKVDRRARRARERAAARARGERSEHDDDKEEDEEDDEEVIVRGYSGNATRTERGIKYLGKRLARYVLAMTYPDQPYLPSSKTASTEAGRAHAARAAGGGADEGAAALSAKHGHGFAGGGRRSYRFTQISFVAHSLGGLVQTYAVAYLQKHSPQFFDLIEPVNFIGMASPFLGLNHENPLYVKFALDFGLVGRTGQDLGLTWRPPTLARSGWGAIVGNLTENAHKKILGDSQPESKPLLRILPTGPAHTALKKFRNRTVYSNVVNDGIVPLRTSCLLFLDWQGLGRVEKARREAGLVESVVGFGWAELTGTNVTTNRIEKWEPEETEPAVATAAKSDGATDEHSVPLPSTNATREDDRQSLRAVATPSTQLPDDVPMPTSDSGGWLSTASTNNNPFSNLLNFFKGGSNSSSDTTTPPAPPTAATAMSSSSDAPASSHASAHMLRAPKKIYQRSQTLHVSQDGHGSSRSLPSAGSQEAGVTGSSSDTSSLTPGASKSRVTTGHELSEEVLSDITGSGGGGSGGGGGVPPKTSFFESAADIINPKLPSVEYIIDPSKRPRTIFHDRVYHPSDIPPPPLKRRQTSRSQMIRRLSFQRAAQGSREVSGVSVPGDSGIPVPPLPSSSSCQDSVASEPDEVVDSAGMKVEEKIARAYHRGMSWRKVLVKLEPDAHNNMIVRRTFANAFGWPVVQHMVDAHFSDSAAARTRDDDEEGSVDNALSPEEAPDENGAETRTQRGGTGGEEEKGGGEEGRDSRGGEEGRDSRGGEEGRDRGGEEGRDSRGGEEKERRDSKSRPGESAEESDGHSVAERKTEAGAGQSSSPSATEDDGSVPGRGASASVLPVRSRPKTYRRDSVTWSESDWDNSDDSDGDEEAAAAKAAAAAQGGNGKLQKKARSGGGGGVGSSQAAKPFSGVTVTATLGTTTGPAPPFGALGGSPLGEHWHETAGKAWEGRGQVVYGKDVE